MYEGFNLTENEKLYDNVSHQRLIELIQQPNVEVLDSVRSTNNYGEFRFITLAYANPDGSRRGICFWGNGYHEYRESNKTNWEFYSGLPLRDLRPIPKQAAIKEIEQERLELGIDAPELRKPSREAELFSLLADLTDEDGAYSELCM